MAEFGKGNAITWYDVLGLLPGASAEQVKSRHDAKASLLRPEHLAGAPSTVIAAASRARDILDSARRVLADPADRARYDQAIGIRRSGGGLEPDRGSPSEPGWDTSDAWMIGNDGEELLGGLLMLSDLMTSHPRPPRRVVVPAVTGLFYSTCFGITGKLGFRLAAVRLTEHPMPVDGLIVGQTPGPAVKARRGSELTVQVWHPSAKR